MALTCSLFLILVLSFVPLSSQPLSLGVVILIVAVIFSVLISYYISSWYGLILFIIYVGALLVMFSYMVVLAYNPILSMFNWRSYSLILFFISVLSFDLWVNWISENSSFSIEAFSFTKAESVGMTSGIFSLVGLGIFLLLCLVVVVKISTSYGSPFRIFKLK